MHNDEGCITVYRGTSNANELNIYDHTGLVMSDSARKAYMETRNLELAYEISQNTHNRWIEIWGNENDYIQAHSAFGLELPSEFGLDRTLVSMTTDRSIAERFAGRDGRVLELQVPMSQLKPQTFIGAGESEFLIVNGLRY